MRVAKKRKQMNSRLIRMLALFVLTLLLTSGCATGGKYMTEANRISGPEQGKALVTFVRPSGFGSAISRSDFGTVIRSWGYLVQNAAFNIKPFPASTTFLPGLKTGRV